MPMNESVLIFEMKFFLLYAKESVILFMRSLG